VDGSSIFAIISSFPTNPSTSGFSAAALQWKRTSYLGCSGFMGTLPNSTISGIPASYGIGTSIRATDFDGIYYSRSVTRMTDVTDGTSNVFMFGEGLGGRSGGSAILGFTWMSSGTLPAAWDLVVGGKPSRDWPSFSSEHPNIVLFALGDGSVKTVTLQIDGGQYYKWSGAKDGFTQTSDSVQ
jgi:hypothetical protein